MRWRMHNSNSAAPTASSSPVDQHVSQVSSTASLASAVRGSGINLIGALCNQMALLITTLIIARWLGREQFGEYALGLAILTILGLFTLGGFQEALTRYVAIYSSDGDMARLRGVLRLALGLTITMSLAVALALLCLSGGVSTAFHLNDFRTDLIIIAVTLPAWTIRDGCLAAVRGWRTQRAFALITWVYEPLVRLTLTVAALVAGLGVTGAFGALAIGSWTAAGLATRALAKRARAARGHRPRIAYGQILRYSAASWGTTMATAGLIWADTLILGGLVSAAAVGVYNVSTKLVNIAVFVMLPVNNAFAPQFARFLHRREKHALVGAYKAATTWIMRLSLPAFVVLLTCPTELLSVFGRGYVLGATVTVVLAFGQLVNAATGPCGAILNMSGRNVLNTANNVVVLGVNVGLNFWLIPRHGIVGAALAWSISLAIVNLARMLEVAAMVHRLPFGLGTLKAAAAACIAGLTVIVTDLAALPTITHTVLKVGVIVIVYSCSVALLRFDAADRALLSDLRHSARQLAAARE